MNKEIEIKLSISPKEINKLLECSYIMSLKGEVEQKTLKNTYFDTGDWQLNKQKIALRVRKSDRQYIQTLKTQGISEQGMHQRLEWEWDLKSEQLDFTLLPKDHWPENIDLKTIEAQFSTNFTRRLWYVTHIDQTGVESVVEMALDQGLVTAKSTVKTIAISELELELVSGSPVALTEIAKILIAQCPQLQPSDISKAARGFQLLQA